MISYLSLHQSVSYQQPAISYRENKGPVFLNIFLLCFVLCYGCVRASIQDNEVLVRHLVRLVAKVKVQSFAAVVASASLVACTCIQCSFFRLEAPSCLVMPLCMLTAPCMNGSEGVSELQIPGSIRHRYPKPMLAYAVAVH